jgi:hypothetical protein
MKVLYEQILFLKLTKFASLTNYEEERSESNESTNGNGF